MGIQYFLVGSHYYGDKDRDVLSEMEVENVVSIDWAKELDMTNIYGRSDAGCAKYLKSKNVMGKASNNLRRFLQLRAGDLIAIKRWEMKNHVGRVEVRAYARVVEREGKVYSWDSENLGHTVNVKYLRKDISIWLPYNYSQAVHIINKQDRVEKIFIEVLSRNNNKSPQKRNKGTKNKNTKSQRRSGNRSYVARQKHNKLQQKVYDYLVVKYGNANVRMEKNYVDITLNIANTETLYEVKAYNSIKKCIREGLGQLIEYSYKDNSQDKVMVVVGLSLPREDDLDYIKFVKEKMNLPFYYCCFVRRNLISY